MSEIDYLFRAPLAHPSARGSEPPHYRRTTDMGMMIERDVPVTLRDGVTMYVDIYRPEDGTPAAPIIGWQPYGKHGHTRYSETFPNAGVDQEALSRYTAFEMLDPAAWVPRGYAIINPDPRGTWYSEGRATYVSPEETQDFCELIRWAGTRDWSNGKVGLSGVSYLAVMQWFVAAERPDYLAAINPWEGWSDTYRELARHGGIPETGFWPYLPGRWGHSTTEVEDLMAEDAAHPFLDAFWESKAAKLEQIEVPAFVVGSWSDQGLHTRGTLEGFRRMASTEKWLEIHGRKKWAYYYEPEPLERLRQFFDFYLLGKGEGAASWPRVRYELRDRFYEGEFKGAAAWPLPDVVYRDLHLDPASSILATAPPAPSRLAYESTDGSAQFDIAFDTETHLVGHMTLTLWVAAEAADDADLFVAVQKLDAAGKVVPFAFWAHFDEGPVALGWLRASHRELDPDRSTDFLPVHAHARALPLTPGEPTELKIEIWPSGTRFAAGEGLRLIVQGRDVYVYPEGVMSDRHDNSVNRGRHILFGGGDTPSRLTVPVVG